MSTLRFVTFLLLFVSASLPGFAQDEHEHGWALDVKAGSLGVGADISRSIVPGLLNIRAGASFFSYSTDFDMDGTNYFGRLKLGAIPVAVDVFPFRNWFRIGGGIVVNMNEVTGSTPASGIIEFQGDQFDIDDFGQVRAKIGFRRVAPYFGVGFSNPIRRGGNLGFFADLGFMYHGRPSLTLTSGLTIPEAQAEIAREEQNINDDIKNYRFFPVAQVGFSYRF